MSLSIEDRIKAEAQVDAFIEILAKRYGLKDDEIPALLNDVRWIADHRRSISRMGWAAILGVISLTVSGIWLMMLEGVKHTLTGK